jgi:cysteine sulfinate desulfinase/cysteine desulfurase-like protein
VHQSAIMKTCILAGALLASAVAATITPTVNNVGGIVRDALELSRLRRRQVQQACTDAVAALGAAKVDTQPLNSTTVSKNW